MDYGSSDTSTTTLGANQFPISEVYVPNGTLTALEGGPASTDGGGKKSAPASMYVKDGGDIAQGSTTDVAVTGDNAGTLSAKLRGLSKILADVWDSVNHRLNVTANPQVSSTSALTSVAAAVASTQLLASNSSRKGYRVYNDSTAIMYLAESGSASTTAYTVQVPANGFWESPATPVWQGAVFAVWSAANGNARITELS